MNENKTSSPLKICKMFTKNCELRVKFQMKAKYHMKQTSKKQQQNNRWNKKECIQISL